MRSIVNWRVFRILLSLSLLSVIAVFPYVMTVQHDVLAQIPVPIFTIFLLQLMQSAVLFSVTIFIGLILIQKINFHLTLKKNARTYGLSILMGIVTAIAIYATDILFTLGGASISTSQNIAPIWQKLLAAFYGGITEELLMRLFLMSLLIWMGMKLARKTTPPTLVILISIIFSSIIFGLGHLPITATLTAITPLIFTRAIVLNGIGGIIFGWLYWKRGLVSAMMAHFTADIFLLSILPLLH